MAICRLSPAKRRAGCGRRRAVPRGPPLRARNRCSDPMRLALFADIHGNREAFDACLDHARHRGADSFGFMGDLVGYGADPAYIVDTVAEYCERGAFAILGNHDAAVLRDNENMNDYARAAIEWTRDEL